MFQREVLLSKYSHYKIGGPARYFLEAKNMEEIIIAVEKARQIKTPIFVLGGGTNILFDDEGFEGLVLKPDIRFIEKDDNVLKVGAGVLMNQLVDYSMSHSLSGLEWAAGLPGTVGGAIYGNAGAFGSEMKDIVKEVVSLGISRSRPKIIKRKNENCGFGYRSSIFKFNIPVNQSREIILEATLVFKKGDRKLIQETAEKNIAYRQKNQPLEYPSLGSVFKNVDCRKIPKSQQQEFKTVIKTDPFPVIPAAYLIAEAGLKGVSCGGAMISPKHPNFIVNVLNATAKDVKNLIELIKKEVKKKFNIELEEEIKILA